MTAGWLRWPSWPEGKVRVEQTTQHGCRRGHAAARWHLSMSSSWKHLHDIMKKGRRGPSERGIGSNVLEITTTPDVEGVGWVAALQMYQINPPCASWCLSSPSSTMWRSWKTKRWTPERGIDNKRIEMTTTPNVKGVGRAAALQRCRSGPPCARWC